MKAANKLFAPTVTTEQLNLCTLSVNQDAEQVPLYRGQGILLLKQAHQRGQQPEATLPPVRVTGAAVTGMMAAHDESQSKRQRWDGGGAGQTRRPAAILG